MFDPGGPLATAGRNFSNLARSHATLGVAAGLLAIHFAIAAAEPGIGWYENFGLSRRGFLTGKIWQLSTHALIHGAWWHALLNALFVLLIGSRVEHMTGAKTMLGVTLAGVLCGGLFHLLLGTGLLVGMSGGCMALLLLLTTLSPQSRMMPLPLSGRSLGMGILLAALVLALMNPELQLPVFSDAGRWLERNGQAGLFQMGHACHFGGALAGWIFGRWILRPRVTLASLRRDRARREAR
jgi:membrane associated rhomboid family serine protease